MNPNGQVQQPTPQPMQPQPAPMQGPPQPQQRPSVPNAPVVQTPPPSLNASGPRQLTVSPIAHEKIKDMYGRAADNAPLLDALLKITAIESRARPISNFKNPQTMVNKVDEKNQEDPKRNYQLEDVNDVVRGRLVYGTMDALRKGITDFKQNLKGSGASVVKTEDFFKKPEDGYEGFHIDLRFPNNLHAEVQFHTEQSYSASMATHGIHAQFGDMPPKQLQQKTLETNQKILSMNPAQAKVISQQKEAETAPAQHAAQQAALRMILMAKQQQMQGGQPQMQGGQGQQPPQMPQGGMNG